MRAFLDISSDDWSRWSFLTHNDGGRSQGVASVGSFLVRFHRITAHALLFPFLAVSFVEAGTLVVQTLLDKSGLVEAGIPPAMAYVTSSDIGVWKIGKNCFRYATVAYGDDERGALS